MNKKQILERLRKLKSELRELFYEEDILVGVGPDYFQTNEDIFVLLANGADLHTQWSDGYLHIDATVDGLHLCMVIASRKEKEAS